MKPRFNIFILFHKHVVQWEYAATLYDERMAAGAAVMDGGKKLWITGGTHIENARFIYDWSKGTEIITVDSSKTQPGKDIFYYLIFIIKKVPKNSDILNGRPLT